MNTNLKSMVLTGFFCANMIILNSCTKDVSESQFAEYATILEVSDFGATSVLAGNLKSVLSGTVVADETDLDVLVNMKEEEKLARDVYSALYNKWNNSIFLRISNAENTHMNAVILLLQDYGTEYTSVMEAGKFSNSAFETLYTELVAKGSVSLEEAWKTGALIEEMDITDLIKSLTGITDENIKIVFENLQKGSRNHLRAFTRQLSALGVTYSPVYMSVADYNQIVSSPPETGNKYKMNRFRKGRFGMGTCNQ